MMKLELSRAYSRE